MPNKKPIFIIFFFFFWAIEGFAQRYNFKQYDIEDGLIQSQITAITQDKQKRLWIATLGGLSCFNGNQFTNLGKTNGLNSNFILSVALDSKNNLLIGTERGLSTYKGEAFYNFKDIRRWTDKLTPAPSGDVYGISGENLFKVNGPKTELLTVTDDTAEIVTALKNGPGGRVWAAVYQKGVYCLNGNEWQQEISGKQVKDLIITDLLADNLTKDKIWLLTTTGIYIAEKAKVKQAYQRIIKSAMAIGQDESGNIWLGTSKGAWYISKQQLIHFNAKNGFTDNTVNKIFRDAENNIWLGTDGSGIFKFNSKSYVTFDESQGLQNSIVMAISPGLAPNETWLGTYDGLFIHKNNKINRIAIPSDNEDTRRINFLLKDSRNRLWIATVGGGLWVYNKDSFQRIDKGTPSVACNAILEDRHANIWLSTNFGCFVLSSETKKISRVTTNFSTSLLEIDNELIISGTQNGAYLIRNKTKISPLTFKPLLGSSILSMMKYGSHVLFGTADNGLIVWNIKTGKIRHLTTKDGLLSDHIYSLLADKKGNIWTGTGRGINRLNAKDFSILKNENELVVECNQNAILENQGNIWIGTTKGVVVYYNQNHSTAVNKPYIFINSVSILAQNTKGNQNNLQVTYKGDNLRKKITLPYNKNHLNINFTGIYLSNPKAVLYQYRLQGLDNKYSRPEINSSINYTALPPGKYTFQVKAVTISGIESVNMASLDFEIRPPYYQTTIFKIFVLFIVLLVITLSAYVVINLSERQRKLRLKIKLEEQFKIRKQTAEDFHDDIGNKLTRISVLSEVLSSMTNKDDVEKRAIIQKIKTNVNELYTGTKDILWSLNPKNDTLGELLIHIKEFGYEMFNDTPVTFEDETFIDDTSKRLSLEMSRNILMIFKEAINNTLKYSKADHVHFTAGTSQDVLEIQLKDNGSGFDPEAVKNGQGINNMKVRAARIKGSLSIYSDKNGTTIALSVKFKY